MRQKHFEDYLSKRLSGSEISEIEEQAKMEYESLRMLQEDVSKAIVDYMAEHNIGFNDFVRQTGKSPTQVSSILKGEANLTLATIAQLYACMGRAVRITSR